MTILDQWTDGFAEYRKVRTGYLGLEYVQIKYPHEHVWHYLP